MNDPFIGTIIMFGGNFAPRGWALCDGQLLSIASYSSLFSILGTTYGGDGRTTFGLPEMRGRVPVHQGNGPGVPPYNLGQKGGTATNTLTTTNIPSHSHTLFASNAVADANKLTKSAKAGPALKNANLNIWDNNFQASATAGLKNKMHPKVIGATGGGQAVNNMQPYLAVNFIIALQGIYPSRN